MINYKILEKVVLIFLICWFIFAVGYFFYCAIGFLEKPKDVLVKDTNEYIYVKQYSLYGNDSVVKKFHKPITYDGTIIEKRKSSSFVGVVGKGGHRVYHYYVTIQYNGKLTEINDSRMFDNVERGQTIKVIETFYPSYDISYVY